MKLIKVIRLITKRKNASYYSNIQTHTNKIPFLKIHKFANIKVRMERFYEIEKNPPETYLNPIKIHSKKTNIC